MAFLFTFEDPEEFALLHDFNLRPIECVKCGHKNLPKHTAISQDYYGILVGECAKCGVNSNAGSFLARSKEKKAIWSRWINLIR
jgi:Zn ribbon nucleic-acid-binding protein